ncbi:MAG: hypothetical protein QXP35_02050 [Candidatus Micrarchaeaceae archaeon]
MYFKTTSNIANLLRTKSEEFGLRNYNPSSFEIDIATILKKYNINFNFNQQLIHQTTENSRAFNMPNSINIKNNFISTNIKINNKEEIFRPDFIINDLNIDNKTLLLEPHGKQYFSDKKILKYKNFMDFFKDEYYVVLITDASPKILKNKLNKLNLKFYNICDEVIFSEKNLAEFERRIIRIKNLGSMREQKQTNHSANNFIMASKNY